jgi:hypothetical protein
LGTDLLTVDCCTAVVVTVDDAVPKQHSNYRYQSAKQEGKSFSL